MVLYLIFAINKDYFPNNISWMFFVMGTVFTVRQELNCDVLFRLTTIFKVLILKN